MSPPHCPGQNTQYWKPDDIYFIECPFCGGEIEFWKDEPVRVCPSCKKKVPNPKIDTGCAKWCDHADECQNPPPDQKPRGQQGT